MNDFPYMQFFAGDWMSDPKLSMCSPATRGIWMDALCAMHVSDRAGELSGTTEQLARICRCLPVEMSAAIADLQTTKAADVTIRNSVVTLICRRMKREQDKRKSCSDRVKKHRNGGVTPELPPEKPKRNADVTDTRALNPESESEEEPPNPQPQTAGGEGGKDGDLPKEQIWRRVCAVVGREPTKRKSYLEEQSLYAVSGITDEDMVVVERYAALCRQEPSKYTKPKALAHTLLEEFHAEVGKAKSALGQTGHDPKKTVALPEDWPAFAAHLAAEFPAMRAQIASWKSWDDATRDLNSARSDYLNWRKFR